MESSLFWQEIAVVAAILVRTYGSWTDLEVLTISARRDGHLLSNGLVPASYDDVPSTVFYGTERPRSAWSNWLLFGIPLGSRVRNMTQLSWKALISALIALATARAQRPRRPRRPRGHSQLFLR